MSRLALNEKSPALCLQIPWRRRMKKTLISLSVVSFFTLGSLPVFAYDIVPGTTNNNDAVVIGPGSFNSGGGPGAPYKAGVAIGNLANSSGASVALGEKSVARDYGVAIGPGSRGGGRMELQ